MYSLFIETKAIYKLSNSTDYINFKNKTLSTTNTNLLESFLIKEEQERKRLEKEEESRVLIALQDKKLEKTAATLIKEQIQKSNMINSNNSNNTTTTTVPTVPTVNVNNNNNSNSKEKTFYKRVLLPDSVIFEGVLQPPGTDVTNLKGKGNKSQHSHHHQATSSNKSNPLTTTTTTTTTTTNTTSNINNNNSNNSNITTTTSTAAATASTLALVPNEDKESIPFFSGNPNIEVIEGVLHLFINTTVEKNLTSSLCQLPNSRTNIICIESVPSYMSIPDLIGFFQSCCDIITDMKIIRDASPNKYMVLLRLTDQASADEFYQLFNGKNFSSFEPETCILLYISKVEYQSNSSTYSIMQKPSNSIELPNCPVCLDRLDSNSSGIVTVLCHHSFHCDCLSKWKGDNTCPVCRYVQVPTVESKSVCAICQSTEALWICIICGQVGCSRYVNSHANLHYEETMHTFALELETQRVWDYAGDGYVHRLIQNRADGKVLEFPNPHQSSDSRDGSHLKEEKIESIVMEYNFLLTSQLEQQRAYFEQMINKIEKEHGYRINQLKDDLEKTNNKWQLKFSKLKQKGDDGDKEASFLKQINSAMKENQEKFKQTEEEKDRTIEELSEELRDLRFFIEAQRTLSENHEMKDATIVIPTSTVSPPNQPNNSNNNNNGMKKPKKKK